MIDSSKNTVVEMFRAFNKSPFYTTFARSVFEDALSEYLSSYPDEKEVDPAVDAINRSIIKGREVPADFADTFIRIIAHGAESEVKGKSRVETLIRAASRFIEIRRRDITITPYHRFLAMMRKKSSLNQKLRQMHNAIRDLEQGAAENYDLLHRLSLRLNSFTDKPFLEDSYFADRLIDLMQAVSEKCENASCSAYEIARRIELGGRIAVESRGFSGLHVSGSFAAPIIDPDLISDSKYQAMAYVIISNLFGRNIEDLVKELKWLSEEFISYDVLYSQHEERYIFFQIRGVALSLFLNLASKSDVQSYKLKEIVDEAKKRLDAFGREDPDKLKEIFCPDSSGLALCNPADVEIAKSGAGLLNPIYMIGKNVVPPVKF